MKIQKRSPCPVACTLDLVGDRWTLLLVRDLACGKSTFKEFAASPEGIATNVLADRLARLLEHGLIERYAPPDSRHGAYRFTEKGATLVPVAEALKEWGLAHIAGTEARMKPKRSRPAGNTI